MKIVLYAVKLLFIGLLLSSGTCYGEEIEASSYTQSRIGMIQSMDYAANTAVISGYRYSFNGLKGYDIPPIRLYGSDFGSFTHLKVGMIVKVEYHLAKKSRVVVELDQMANGTKLGVPD